MSETINHSPSTLLKSSLPNEQLALRVVSIAHHQATYSVSPYVITSYQTIRRPELVAIVHSDYLGIVKIECKPFTPKRDITLSPISSAKHQPLYMQATIQLLKKFFEREQIKLFKAGYKNSTK